MVLDERKIITHKVTLLGNDNFIIHHHHNILFIFSNNALILNSVNVVEYEFDEINACTIGMEISSTKSGVNLIEIIFSVLHEEIHVAGAI